MMRTIVLLATLGLGLSCASSGANSAHQQHSPHAPPVESGLPAKELAGNYYTALSRALEGTTPDAAATLFAERLRAGFRSFGFHAWKDCTFTQVHEAEFSVKNGRDGIRTVVSFKCPSTDGTETKFLFETTNGYVLDEL